MIPETLTVPLKTPDLRYLVVRGRLWRTSNPHLSEPVRKRLVDELMNARRAVRDSKKTDDPVSMADARRRVDEAKRELGERGPVWWIDGSPDYNRHLVKNSPYAQWYRDLSLDEIAPPAAHRANAACKSNS